MRIFPGGLLICLPLLVAFEGPVRAQAVRSGDLAFTLSASEESKLPIDLKETVESLCRGETDRSKRGTALRQCSLTVKATIPPAGLGLKIPPTPEGSGERSVDVQSFYFEAEPVDSSCGPWKVVGILDPEALQPTTPLILQEAWEEPEHGVFAGILEMNLKLHLANPATGQTADIAVPLAFTMAGPWALVTESDGLSLLETESNLILGSTRVKNFWRGNLCLFPAFFTSELWRCRFCLRAVLEGGALPYVEGS